MDLNSLQEQISYIIGRDMARNFSQQGLDLNIDVMAASMKAALAGEPSRLSPEQIQEAMQQLQRQLGGDEEQDDDTQDPSAMNNNRAEGQAFLNDNQSKPGVTTLPSGLQYEVLTEGSGKKPGPRSQVTTHYHGTLINGRVFDSSYQRGQPATFGVDQVISGWTEALQLMPEGSKWRLYIPSELAYGKRGAGRDIGPDSALIFDVELLKVNN